MTINSDIPVTVARYNDDRYADGEQPVFPTDAFVIVTSNCDATTTPQISWDYSEGGSVTINSGANFIEVDHLEPASYKAEWEWLNWGCDVYPTPSPFSSSVFSLGPTDAGQVVTVQTQGETQTLEEFQTEQKESGGGGESDDVPFKEEEYKPSSSAGKVGTALLGGVLLVMMMVMDHHRWMSMGTQLSVAALSLSPMVSHYIKRSNISRASQSNRSLQTAETCIYQAEILLDGCTHPLQINAPSVRIVDALVKNSNSEKGVEEPCLYQYTADITFPTTDAIDSAYEGMTNVEIDALSYGECVRATDGRPFIDATGGSLVARPLVGGDCNDCSDASMECTSVNSSNNTRTTPQSHFALGEEWTQRALGEHASIASFSAFSIALMTNAAPSSLVEDALVAAMDEVRHARTSFDIASRLIGKEVTAGPLPPSKHEFDQDLIKLGLAVAREGCVDETLSAIAAAVESMELTHEKVGKYAVLDMPTVDWIKSELIKIAMEEATHSALAWRTLFWICSVNTEACNAVKEEVLHEHHLDARFNYRFTKTFGEKPELLSTMKEAWRKIYERLASLNTSYGESEGVICAERKSIIDGNNIISELTDHILYGTLCKAEDAPDASRIVI